MRAGGKHNDLDDVGRTNRHFSFFEMLGNFSFGDYFKPTRSLGVGLLHRGLGLDPDRLWVTVHETDDEAERIWRDDGRRAAGAHPAPRRGQLLAHGRHRPVRPSSEIFWDLGPDAGPTAARHASDRYIEIWNLVFMQFDAQPDGTLVPLPKPSIDTGAGLERCSRSAGTTSIWDIDVFRPLIASRRAVTGARYGTAPTSGTSRCASSPSTAAR